MTNMMLFGNGLGKKYKTKVESDIKSDAEVSQAKNDRAALKKYHATRRVRREERMSDRDLGKKTVTQKGKEELTHLKNDQTQMIKDETKKVKAQTNHLARKYGLTEPNNPEALEHDRLYCYKCDTHLHIPNAYKDLPEEVQKLLGDDSGIRHFCCYCFGKMEHGEIMKLQENDESTKKIRMMIYDPEEGAKLQVEDMTKERKAYIQSKIKKYESVISLVGNVKHDYLQEGDDIENIVRNNANTRWNYGGR